MLPTRINPDAGSRVSLGGLDLLLVCRCYARGQPIGVIGIWAGRGVEPFTEHQIELVRTFAARRLSQWRMRGFMTETREALEQQTATAEVLQVINSSPGNLEPVFDAMLEKAIELCEAPFGHPTALSMANASIWRRLAVIRQLCRACAQDPCSRPGRRFGPFVGGELSCTSGTSPDDTVPCRLTGRRALSISGARTVLGSRCARMMSLLAFFTIYRKEVRPFSDKQIALLQNFAAQAVIAMENARLHHRDARGPGAADRDG